MPALSGTERGGTLPPRTRSGIDPTPRGSAITSLGRDAGPDASAGRARQPPLPPPGSRPWAARSMTRGSTESRRLTTAIEVPRAFEQRAEEQALLKAMIQPVRHGTVRPGPARRHPGPRLAGRRARVLGCPRAGRPRRASPPEPAGLSPDTFRRDSAKIHCRATESAPHREGPIRLLPAAPADGTRGSASPDRARVASAPT